MRKLTKIFVCMLTFGMIVISTLLCGKDTLVVRAQDMSMLYLNCDASIYQEKSTDSSVVLSLPKGSLVLVTGTDGDWTGVQYQDKEGFMESSCLQAESPDPAIKKELSSQEEYDVEYTNELTRLRSEQRRSRIWGIIIVAIVVAMFATGIIQVLRAGKKGKEDKEDES
jgi:uncharacterized protein YgiM (DUF1202 family)